MHRNFQKVVVMGLGYIGLPTASMLATVGHEVIGVDVNEDIVSIINYGRIHIVEPDLDILVKSAVKSGRLKASLVPEAAQTFIIAVPTPFRYTASNPKAPDISYVEAATRAIAPFLSSGNLVILESTSPVGTTERIAEVLAEIRPELFSGDAGQEVHIAHCPERVLPGHIIRELVDNDRIIGGISHASAEKAKELYKTFCNGQIFLTNSKTAEMAKLVENSYRDVNIAFANELSLICDKNGVDVWELIQLANKHPRVNILSPGPGVGGHCIAVDPWFVVAAAPEDARLIRTAREVNDFKPEWVVAKVTEHAGKLSDPTIGCLGLAYKANIDDLRESPAFGITRQLIASRIGRIMACEPNVSEGFQEFKLHDLEEVLDAADIILVLVDHEEFKEIPAARLAGKVVLDTRGVLRA